MLGSIGMPELIIIFVIALIVFGPRKLPDLGRSLGQGIHEFKKATRDVQQRFEVEVEAEKRATAAPAPTVAAPAPTVTPEPASDHRVVNG